MRIRVKIVIVINTMMIGTFQMSRIKSKIKSKSSKSKIAEKWCPRLADKILVITQILIKI